MWEQRIHGTYHIYIDSCPFRSQYWTCCVLFLSVFSWKTSLSISHGQYAATTFDRACSSIPKHKPLNSFISGILSSTFGFFLLLTILPTKSALARDIYLFEYNETAPFWPVKMCRMSSVAFQTFWLYFHILHDDTLK